MCGRYANTKSGEELGRYFEADEVDEVRLPPSWNIAPTQRVFVVVDTVPKGLAGSGADAPVTRRVTTARWSLVPRFQKQLASKYPTFNARSETAAEKPTFRSSVARSRALVPADGYYEWLTVGKTKTPYFVTDPFEGELAFAGLFSWWRPPVAEGEEPEPWVLTATILTRAAAGPAAAATATGAAAVTSKTSSNFFTNSLSSMSESSLNASMSSSVVSFAMIFSLVVGTRREPAG